MAKGNTCELCGKAVKTPEAKSLPKLKKDLEKVFNEYIRLRDRHGNVFKCISCGKWKPVKNMHAGHFHAAGHNEAVRWDERNVNGQCDHCNTFLHANLLGYREGMARKYGERVIDLLEIKRHNKSKMGKFEISVLIQEYKRKVKEIKKCSFSSESG
jgi:hypothetical protein